jgi:hypothetical protein
VGDTAKTATLRGVRSDDDHVNFTSSCPAWPAPPLREETGAFFRLGTRGGEPYGPLPIRPSETSGNYCADGFDRMLDQATSSLIATR